MTYHTLAQVHIYLRYVIITTKLFCSDCKLWTYVDCNAGCSKNWCKILTEGPSTLWGRTRNMTELDGPAQAPGAGAGALCTVSVPLFIQARASVAWHKQQRGAALERRLSFFQLLQSVCYCR